MEVKVLDALIESTLAPYSRKYGASPFRNISECDVSAYSIQMLLYYTSSEMVAKNSAAQAYVARSTARVWKSSGIKHAIDCMCHRSEDPQIQAPTSKLEKHERVQERWINLLIYQSADPLGSTLLLTELVKGSTAIFPTPASSNDFLQLIKALIRNIGPERRLLSMISALCAAGGISTRAHQEACVRALWMQPKDRYAFGLTFHELPEAKPKEVTSNPVTLKKAPRNKRSSATESYEKTQLVGGDTTTTSHSEIAVCWHSPGSRESPTEWRADNDALWFAPEDLGLLVVGSRNPSLENTSPDCKYNWPSDPTTADISDAINIRETIKIDHDETLVDLGQMPLVPIQHLLWPLEPQRLCK